MLGSAVTCNTQRARALADTSRTVSAAAPAPIETMPFEQAMSELERIVDTLEKGQVALEESITLYERGERLKQRCEALLKNAEMRVQKIVVGDDGEAKGLTPLDPV